MSWRITARRLRYVADGISWWISLIEYSSDLNGGMAGVLMGDLNDSTREWRTGEFDRPSSIYTRHFREGCFVAQGCSDSKWAARVEKRGT